jgi:hypothetical protein
MNDREFSDIEIFERSRKGISLFMLMLCYLFIYILFIWSIQYGVITQQDIEHVKINTYASFMYKLKKIGKVFTSKLLGPGPSSYKQTIYRAAVSQRLGNTDLDSLSSVVVFRLVLQCLI